MKARLGAFAIVVALLAGAGVAVWFVFLRPGKLDFDKLGGTILVYEIDPNEAEDRFFDPVRDIAVLVEVLQGRLDPDDRGFAAVQAVGKDRVEIRVPRQEEGHAEELTRLKELLKPVGRLDFRILANSEDDKVGIKRAREMLNAADDPEMLLELKNAQEKGLPPPGPRVPQAREPLVVVLDLAQKEKSVVTYSWVELSPQERKSLILDSVAPIDRERDFVWREAEKSRGKATTLLENPHTGRHLMQGALFYSRTCENRNLPDDERKRKAVEYFVLARDPERDPNQLDKRTPAVDGSFLTHASHGSRREEGGSLWHFVNVRFNAEGAELFHTLTRKNVPTGVGPEGERIRRYLAIILDGQVLSAPTLNSAIPGGQAQIGGNFTEAEARALAAILGGGSLPARLKAMPLSVQEVPPK